MFGNSSWGPSARMLPTWRPAVSKDHRPDPCPLDGGGDRVKTPRQKMANHNDPSTTPEASML